MQRLIDEDFMKKFVFTAFASVAALSAQAADYPAECRELIDLTF